MSSSWHFPKPLSTSCNSSSWYFFCLKVKLLEKHVRQMIFDFRPVFTFLSTAWLASSSWYFCVDQFFRAIKFQAVDHLPLKCNDNYGITGLWNVAITVSGPDRQGQGRFITFIITTTTTVTPTLIQSTTPLQVSTLFFTSNAAAHCFPAGLMATAGDQAC